MGVRMFRRIFLAIVLVCLTVTPSRAQDLVFKEGIVVETNDDHAGAVPALSVVLSSRSVSVTTRRATIVFPTLAITSMTHRITTSDREAAVPVHALELNVNYERNYFVLTLTAAASVIARMAEALEMTTGTMVQRGSASGN